VVTFFSPADVAIFFIIFFVVVAVVVVVVVVAGFDLGTTLWEDSSSKQRN